MLELISTRIGRYNNADYGLVALNANSASETPNVIPVKSPISSVDGWIGQQLKRPECVVAHESGLLLVPNWSDAGGVSLINSAGRTHHIMARHSTPLRPNGIALENGGSILLAHLGETNGGIFRLYPSGDVERVVNTVESEPMPPANYVVQDSHGRIWFTVSTRKIPRSMDYRADANSGFIAVAEPGAQDARILADGLGYTNECVIDEQQGHVYVNETFGRRLSSFKLSAIGAPQLRFSQIICEFGNGTYPDGLALDEQGNLWVTSIISNRLLRVSSSGNVDIMFEDSVQEHIDWTEEAYKADALGRAHLDKARGREMKNISNAAFAGKSRSRLYLGNLLGDSLPFIDTEYCGVQMPHWRASLGELELYL